ncbi:unnamed protein product [Prunus armeniaca]
MNSERERERERVRSRRTACLQPLEGSSSQTRLLFSSHEETHLLLLDEIVYVHTFLTKFPIPSFLVHLRLSFEGINKVCPVSLQFLESIEGLLEECKLCEKKSLVHTSLAQEGEGAGSLRRIPC